MCCTYELGHAQIFRNNQVDKFQRAGACFQVLMTKIVTVTLEKTGDDAWKVEWAQIKLESGWSFKCSFNVWLDNKKTVNCIEGILFLALSQGFAY